VRSGAVSAPRWQRRYLRQWPLPLAGHHALAPLNVALPRAKRLAALVRERVKLSGKIVERHVSTMITAMSSVSPIVTNFGVILSHAPSSRANYGRAAPGTSDVPHP
jgi:hypothetical protein